MLLTLEKLKAQLGGVQAKLNFETVLPFVRVAERNFRRTVGTELYDYLSALESAEGDEAELLELAHGCIAWAAYDLALPHLKPGRVPMLASDTTSTSSGPPTSSTSTLRWLAATDASSIRSPNTFAGLSSSTSRTR